MAAADTSTLYCTLSPISFSDFTPSRTTRVSSNPVLQEHSVVETLCKKRKASTSSQVATNTIAVTKPRRGRYVEVEFVALLKKNAATRKHSLSDPTGSSHALHLRSRIDPSRKAVRVKNICDGNFSNSRAATCKKSQLRPTISQQRWPTLTAKLRYSPPSSSPPPLPPPSILARSTVSLDRILLDTTASGGLLCGVRPTETSQFLSCRGLEDGVTGSRHVGGCKALNRRPLQSVDSSCTPSPPFSPQRSDSLSPIGSPLHHIRCEEGLAANKMSRKCERRPSFIELEAGAETHTCYRAEYMGFKVVDEYADRVDECALQLINSRPTEATVYITAKKVYIAHQVTCSTDMSLVASFAVRDVLHVSRCSKNRWIIGMTTWRFRSTPECRIFKCSDSMTATALYDAVQAHVQNLDNVTTCEVSCTLVQKLWTLCWYVTSSCVAV